VCVRIDSYIYMCMYAGGAIQCGCISVHFTQKSVGVLTAALTGFNIDLAEWQTPVAKSPMVDFQRQ
jgi:hypothetical protein